MKAPRVILLAALGIGVVMWYRILPPRARTLAVVSSQTPAPVRGAIHIHTRRSDGTGTVEEIAAAASRAGLKFVVFTDHGEATREPEPPVYRDGVLCIDAVEISTDGGHVVALDLPRAPYPLGGEPRDVLDDVSRLGGMSIAAHPGSTKNQLRWVEWTAPFDGLEWLNGDSEWRDEAPVTLARVLMTYPFRRSETLTSLLDHPEALIARWDVLSDRRRVVAVAAADAHARVALRGGGEPYEGGSLHLPAYEQVFRAFSISLPLLALTDNAIVDARRVLDAIRQGRVYTSIDGVAMPAVFSFTATSGAAHVAMGDAVPAGGPITFRVDSNAPVDARITLLKNGKPIRTADGSSLEQLEMGEAGVYRVEVHLPGAPGDPAVPWIVSNPIYVRPPGSAERPPDPRRPATEFAPRYEDGFATDWTVESSARSQGALDVVADVNGTQLSLRYAIGGTLSESPFVALVMPAGPGMSGYDRLMFTAHATRPMRVSVQLRVPEGETAERWHRSVYIDEMPRELSVVFDEMTPSGLTARRRPVLSNVKDVLFVVDTVNTRAGTSGQIWIDDVKYAR